MKAIKYALIAMVGWILMGCGTFGGESSYVTGVAANSESNIAYQSTQMKQLDVSNKCYDTATNTIEKAFCAIVQNGTVPVQTLGGRPTAIRVAKTPGEITESIVSKTLDVGGMVYGANLVGNAVQSGISAAGKPPLVVRPEIVNPVIVGP